MASHLSTPKSILNAPQGTHAFVDGTEFTGRNRADRRRMHRQPSPTAYSLRVRRVAWNVRAQVVPGTQSDNRRRRVARMLRRLAGAA